MPDSDGDIPADIASRMDQQQTIREQGGDPNYLPGVDDNLSSDPILSLKFITERNRPFSTSRSFLRFCSDRELLDELHFRGYGRPDPK